MNESLPSPILRQLYGLWDAYTKELLKEPMIPPYIMLSSPARPQALGDFSPVSGFGGHSQIMIRPTLLTGHHKALRKGERYAEGRFLFVADVLLHETVHQYHQEVMGETEESYKGHGPAFRNTCIRDRGATRLAACQSRQSPRARKGPAVMRPLAPQCAADRLLQGSIHNARGPGPRRRHRCGGRSRSPRDTSEP